MPSARRVSQRRVVVRRLDTRCQGGYRQHDDQPALISSYAAASDALPCEWRLECGGRVRQHMAFDYAQLLGMATVDHRLGLGIALTDLLAHVGLETGAEVLVAHESTGRTFGVPIREVIADDNARLTLGASRRPLRPGTGFPVRFDVPGWTDPSKPVVVDSLRAVDFSEFVRCP